MKIIILLCLLHYARAEISEDKIWEDYKTTFKKNYKSEKQVVRAKNLVQNKVQEVELHNKAFAKGDVMFTLGLNEFSDTNLSETRNKLCRTVPRPNPRGLLSILDDILDPILSLHAPKKLDWSSFMQPIVHQGNCGCCWAFATIAQLEFLYMQENLLSSNPLSTQYLVDCSTVSPNSGCFGGWPKVAMEFIANTGMPTSAKYRYTGVQDTCKSAKFVSPEIQVKAVQYDLNGREDLLMKIVANKGPVVIVMNASPVFLKYKFGVFYDTDENCPAGCYNVNHAMLLVGYGVDTLTGFPYWLLRNSWGVNWGELGYVKMLRDGSNNCNVACYAMFLKP